MQGLCGLHRKLSCTRLKWILVSHFFILFSIFFLFNCFIYSLCFIFCLPHSAPFLTKIASVQGPCGRGYVSRCSQPDRGCVCCRPLWCGEFLPAIARRHVKCLLPLLKISDPWLECRSHNSTKSCDEKFKCKFSVWQLQPTFPTMCSKSPERYFLHHEISHLLQPSRLLELHGQGFGSSS